MTPTIAGWMRVTARRLAAQFHDGAFRLSLLASFAVLILSLAVSVFAGSYATDHATSPVGDIILSNIPVFNVDDLFVYAPLIFWICLSLYAVSDPRRLPFWLKSIALFVLVRSVFITLTHIGPFPDHIPIDSFTVNPRFNFYIFNSGADLFFSAHTGLPFLNALIFWKNRMVRIFCVLSSIFFGTVVLLGHLHYSIDVASAFFITYAIYHIAVQLFKRDYKDSGLQTVQNIA